jgi:branched-chain amino acid aminotransferase
LEWVRDGEAALSGTAAVLSGVGTLVREGTEIKVGTGAIGPETTRLRDALVAIQQGRAPDRHGWLQRV